MTFPFAYPSPTYRTNINTYFDPLTKGVNITLSDNDLTALNTGSVRTGAHSPHAKNTGKFYFEGVIIAVTLSSPNEYCVGVATPEIPYADTARARSMTAAVVLDGGIGTCRISCNGVDTAAALAGAPTIGDRFGFAYDFTNGTFWIRKNNGNWNNDGAADPATNTNGLALTNMTGLAFTPVFATPVSGDSFSCNFGDVAFVDAVPSGFTAGWPQTPVATNTSVGFTTFLSPNNVNVTLSNSDLTVTHSNTSTALARSIHQKCLGKYYIEYTITTWANGNDGVGFAESSATPANVIASTHDTAIFRSGNIWANNGTSTSLGAVANGDRIDAAIDLTASLVWYRKNGGNWNNSGAANPATGVGGISISTYVSYAPHCSMDGSGTQVVTANFGASAFAGTVPSGFTSGWTIL